MAFLILMLFCVMQFSKSAIPWNLESFPARTKTGRFCQAINWPRNHTCMSKEASGGRACFACRMLPVQQHFARPCDWCFRLKLMPAQDPKPSAPGTCPILSHLVPFLVEGFTMSHRLTSIPGLVRLNRFLGREQLLKPSSSC